jgi:hypothetical protein
VVRRSSQAICIFSSSKVIMAFCTPPPPHTQTHKHMQRYTHQVINNNTDDNDDSLESIPLFCMLVTDAGLFMLKGGLRNRSLKKLVYLLTSLTDLCVLQALYVFYGNDNCMNEKTFHNNPFKYFLTLCVPTSLHRSWYSLTQPLEFEFCLLLSFVILLTVITWGMSVTVVQSKVFLNGSSCVGFLPKEFTGDVLISLVGMSLTPCVSTGDP